MLVGLYRCNTVIVCPQPRALRFQETFLCTFLLETGVTIATWLINSEGLFKVRLKGSFAHCYFRYLNVRTTVNGHSVLRTKGTILDRWCHLLTLTYLLWIHGHRQDHRDAVVKERYPGKKEALIPIAIFGNRNAFLWKACHPCSSLIQSIFEIDKKQ